MRRAAVGPPEHLEEGPSGRPALRDKDDANSEDAGRRKIKSIVEGAMAFVFF